MATDQNRPGADVSDDRPTVRTIDPPALDLEPTGDEWADYYAWRTGCDVALLADGEDAL